MFYMGKWGNPRTKCHPLSRMGLNICQINDGPSGILKKKQNFFCDDPPEFSNAVPGKSLKI